MPSDDAVRSALEEAAAEAERRRRRIRWGLTILVGSLLLLCLLLLDGQL
jgi:hypothetical protein